MEACGADDPLLAVEVPLEATGGAADPFPFLPEVVAFMLVRVGLVQAWTVDVVLCLLIGPFVDIGSTLGALEVSLCFFKVVLVWARLRVSLSLKQLLDVLCSGDFFVESRCCVGWCCAACIDLQLWAGFL